MGHSLLYYPDSDLDQWVGLTGIFLSWFILICGCVRSQQPGAGIADADYVYDRQPSWRPISA